MKYSHFGKLYRVLSGFILLVIVSFLISRSLPGNPVKSMTSGSSQHFVTTDDARLKNAEALYRKLGFHRPLFYLGLSSLAVPDSFKRLPDERFRNFLISISYWSGHPDASYAWCKIYCNKINGSYDKNTPQIIGEKLDSLLAVLHLTSDERFTLRSNWKLLEISSRENYWKRWVPALNFSMDNRFHYWMFGTKSDDFSSNKPERGFLHGSLGKSWIRGMEVKDAVMFPFLLTFLLALLTLCISMPLSLLTGAWLTNYRHLKSTGYFRSFLVFLYSIPPFWIGTLMLLSFSNPNYLNCFPSSSPVLICDSGILHWLGSVIAQWHHFIIPVFVISYSTVVYLTQMTYELLIEELHKPYVLTLRAKGFSENRIIYRSAMKNILVPVLVSTMSIFPALMGGMVIVDYLFTLPGIGAVLSQACDQRDFPVVGGVMLLTGTMTLISFFITDVLTSYIDPGVDEQA